MMSDKKFVAIVAILVILGGGMWLLFSSSVPARQTPTAVPTLDGVAILVPGLPNGVRVTLTRAAGAEEVSVNHTAVFKYPAEPIVSGTVTMFSGFLTEIGGAVRPLYVVPFLVAYGDVGEFVYLGLFERAEAALVHRASLGIGEAVEVTGVEASSPEKVMISFNTRRPGQTLDDVPTTPAVTVAAVEENGIRARYRIEGGGADSIVVADPDPYETVPHTFEVQGQARGFWYFEADFPVEVRLLTGAVVGRGIATARGDWMTEELVPFSVQLEVDEGYEGFATLVLMRDNPSGLLENDARLVMPLHIESTSDGTE